MSFDFSALGMRASGPRQAIYQWLIEHPVHPTVDEIYQALRPSMDTLSRTTVYNVLYALVEKGLVVQLHCDDHEARFEAKIAPHAHFKCKICGALVDLPLCNIDLAPIPSGYEIESTAITYFGRCPKCSQY